MAFMKKKNACDNCGRDLSEVDGPVKEGKHEFCGEDCKKKYKDAHEHEEEPEEEEICEFC